MRCPLRYQIMLPMVAVMLATILAVTALNAYLAASRTVSQIEEQLQEVARTLSDFNFPLTDAVLRQMKGLSGAEYVLVDGSNSVLAASERAQLFGQLPDVEPATRWQELSLGHPVRFADGHYFHIALRLPQRANPVGSGKLHILYPREGYRRAWQLAVVPPLAIGAGALVLVFMLAAGLAGRVSRPITRLRSQVERMAEGDFKPLPLPVRGDEIQDLSQAINRMAAMLTDYEREVRRTERLRTLSQLGGGIAHQMRNAATGARMALDIHATECPLDPGCESLNVAQRQLKLMEKHLQRLLSLGSNSNKPVHHQEIDLTKLVEQLLPLIRPAAQHASVDLQWERPDEEIVIRGDADGLEQLVINLLLNAIEAARGGAVTAGRGCVIVQVEQLHCGAVRLMVSDSGPGPAAEVQGDLFDAFVTEKPHGVGLGLAIVREIAQQHRGTVVWDRIDGLTRFTATIPHAQAETSRVEIAGS